MEIFHTVQKVFRGYGKFPDGLDSVQTVCKVSIEYGYFLDSVDLRTFGAYMSRKRFTHSVRKVFAREILPTGKFQLFVSL